MIASLKSTTRLECEKNRESVLYHWDVLSQTYFHTNEALAIWINQKKKTRTVQQNLANLGNVIYSQKISSDISVTSNPASWRPLTKLESFPKSIATLVGVIQQSRISSATESWFEKPIACRSNPHSTKADMTLEFPIWAATCSVIASSLERPRTSSNVHTSNVHTSNVHLWAARMTKKF